MVLLSIRKTTLSNDQFTPHALGSESQTQIRGQAASYALFATVFLTIFKLFVGVISGSAAVLSEGLHSFLDLVSATVSFFTVREAGKPADDDHPFGHGKIETFSSLIEALLLLIAAGLMIFEGYQQFHDPKALHYQSLAMATIFVSIIVSYFMYRHNLRAALDVESGALHLNALHFLSDVMASAAILIGLVIIRMTGWLWMDALLAFAVAIYILVISAKQLKIAMLELLDAQLPGDELLQIRQILDSFHGQTIEAHDLRTRKSGATRHIDFHLVCCGAMTVNESHAVCDQIEEKILEKFPSASVNIHVEPCESDKTGCRESCPIFKNRRKLCL